MEIGYHASHEQYQPGQLLAYVEEAGRAGFQAAMCSDHITPFSTHQGSSGFAWSWLGSALQATPLSFGTVNAPGQRYHPAIVAHAAATLCQMFPGRFWLALGSGEFINEHITGEGWPRKAERNERLLECVEVIRRLLAGETVTHHGHVTVEDARLWVVPEQPPLIVGAALHLDTAQWVGTWADAMITVAAPQDTLRDMIDAFRQSAGAAKPVYLQAQVAWGRSDEWARDAAWHEWRTSAAGTSAVSDLRLPEHLDEAASHVRPEDMDSSIRISCDTGRHVEWLLGDAELGIDRVYLHNVPRNQEEFIHEFGQQVIPEVLKRI